MHQEAYQDAGHCHKDRVVVHTLQPYGEGRKMNHSWLVLQQKLQAWLTPLTFPSIFLLQAS